MCTQVTWRIYIQRHNLVKYLNLHIFEFLGPRGPLVEPSIFPSTRPVPQQFFWITYIQAYMRYESSEVLLK